MIGFFIGLGLGIPLGALGIVLLAFWQEYSYKGPSRLE